MPSGRNFMFIVSVEVETWYQGLTSELKKMITGRFLTEVVFELRKLRFSFFNLFLSYFDVFSDS